MSDCIFCKIADGEIPSDIIYRDDEVIVFPDINPLAPVHLLVIPLKHISTLAEMGEADTPIIGKLANVANRLAKEKGISETGYRLVMNSGPDSGMGVAHLHMHLLGGRRLSNALG